MIERRNFLKALGIGTAAALAGGAAIGCSATEMLETKETAAEGYFLASAAGGVSFTQSTDVLVIGSGIAGFSAAMAPLEAGFKVMLTDRQNLLGGESYASNGVFTVAATKIQKSAGILTSLDEAWERRCAISGWSGERAAYQKAIFDLSSEWVDIAVETYGSAFAERSKYDDAAEDLILPKGGIGDMESVMTPIRDKMASLGLVTNLGITATSLIVGPDGAVAGARFVDQKASAKIDVSAKKVVIATGGFIGNHRMVCDYLPKHAEAGCLSTCSYSMGEGLKLAGDLGCSLADMENSDNLVADLPAVSAWGAFAPTVQLNPSGKRFAPEDDRFAAANRCFNDGLGYWWTVFDNQLMQSFQAAMIAQFNQKNTGRLIGPFEDVASLANALGVDEQALSSTLSEYDAAVKSGEDPQGKKHWLQSLSAPYYAVKSFPRSFRTRGGVNVDLRGQALSSGGASKAVENLYCCGSAAVGCEDGLSACAGSGLLVGRSIVEDLSQAQQSS